MPRNKLPKETKDLYGVNYKIMMKVIKDDTNGWNDISYSCTVRNNIVKMTVLPPKIYRYSAIHVKLPMALFTELRPKNL